MAAESLPFALEAVSSWELEAWYEDLQEVLSSDDNGGPYIPSPGNEEVSEDAGLKSGQAGVVVVHTWSPSTCRVQAGRSPHGQPKPGEVESSLLPKTSKIK